MKSEVQVARNIASFCVVTIGVVLEHLDVMLVNLYATSMTSYFFSPVSADHALILGFLSYGVSFFFRPLGAAIFGLLGDLAGRKPSMVISLTLMSAATLGLGMIPGYGQIGWVSTGLFLLCRVVQGMSVGGEYGSALTYSYEVSSHRKTLAGALVISATHIGGLAAAVLATHHPAGFQKVFQIAGGVGLLSLLLRTWMIESRTEPRFKPTVRSVMRQSRENLKSYGRAFCVASALVFTFYSSLIYLNETIFQRGLASRSDIFYSNCFLLGAWILLPPFLAYCVDTFQLSYQKWMGWGALGVALSAWPALHLASEMNTFQSMVGAQMVLNLFHIFYCFGTPRYLGELFASSIRSSGVSLGYSLGASFTAGLTPLICHGLVSATGSLESICLPICGFSFLVAYQLIAKGSSAEVPSYA